MSLSKEERCALADMAKDARKMSICPYSGKSVGAAILCSDGRIYTGSNIESAAYSPTLCAERVALARALHDGERSFSAIAVSGGDKDMPAVTPFTPCGVCRQMLSEYCDGKTEVIVATDTGYDVYALKELLPHSFGKEAL